MTKKIYAIKNLFNLGDILLLFAFLFPVILFAQDKGLFTGSIKMKSGIPVTYATVSLNDGEVFSQTDENGVFVFEDLKIGHYRLEVNSIEIVDLKVAVNFNEPNKKYVFSVEKSKAHDLDEMLISVKTEKREIETKGFAVNVIEMKGASLMSLQTNEILDRSAGVKIRQDGGLGSRVNYNLNGLSGRSVKIFIDGIPTENYGGAFSLNSIPPALIERIEVYKGVVPTYLSQDALGGAINVVLKQKINNSLNVSGSFGSFNTHQYNVNGSYRNEKSGFTVNANSFFNYSDNNYRVYGKHIKYIDSNSNVTYPKNGAKRFHDGYKSYGTKIDVGFTDVKWADKFFISGIVSGNRKEIQHGSTMENVYGDRNTKRESYVTSLNYAKKDLLLKGLEVKLDLTYSDLTRQAIDTVGNMYDWSGNTLKDSSGNIIKYTSGAEVSSQKTLEKNRDKNLVLRSNVSYEFIANHKFSINYFYNNFEREVSDELQPHSLQMLVNTRDLRKDILSFNYENKFFNERLQTNLFYKKYYQKVVSNEPFKDTNKPLVGDLYKVNKIEKSINHDGYGMSMSYKIFNELYLLSSVEKAIRLPAETEIFGSNADNLLPSFALEPEKSTNFNIGFNAGPFRFRDHSVGINTTFFYRNVKGMIREGIDSRGNFTQYENLEDVLSKGVDVEVVYSFRDRLMFNLSLSKFDVLFNTKYDKTGAPYHFYKTQIRNEPSFKLNANLAYTFKNVFSTKDNLRLNYNVYYVKKFLRNWANVGGENLDEIPSQYPNDIGIMYQFSNKKLTISLDAKNIFNQRIYDNFGLQKPGKAFYGKVTYSIF